MKERGSQTVMCSVFFLDIVEYSRKSVSGQISLKDRFNRYLSTAIRDVPVTDRIILDTGDGAAINFLGDVEDALKAALSLRESLLSEAADVDPPLLVRMGINLGPVRLVKDINGQPNIVGDGINVAQRVMSFADPSQILVSRSYFDAASRLSPQSAGMFHYQGSRTDKHVREHEVYAIGDPGDKTTQPPKSKPAEEGQNRNLLVKMLAYANVVWDSAAAKLDVPAERLATRFRQAKPPLRVVYVGAVIIAVLLPIVLTVKLIHRADVFQHEAKISPDKSPDKSQDKIDQQSTNAGQPNAMLESSASIKKDNANSVNTDDMNTYASAPKTTGNKKDTVKPRLKDKSKDPKRQKKSSTEKGVEKNSAAVAGNNAVAYLEVRCKAGTEVFVDGAHKGKIGSVPLRIKALPGSHTVIVSHPKAGVFSKDIEIEPGKTMALNPDFCNK